MKIYPAMIAVAADLHRIGIGKDRTNQQQGFKFRGIDDVLNAISGPLSTHGVLMLPRVLDRQVTERKTQRGGTLNVVVIDVEYDLIAAEDGTKHTIRVRGEAMDSVDKATAKALSMAYKTAAIQAFAIPTCGEPDPDAEDDPDKGVDTITKDQLTELADLIEQTGVDIDRFCKAYGVANLSALPATTYETARKALHRKMERRNA